jgi:hypothetical protein
MANITDSFLDYLLFKQMALDYGLDIEPEMGDIVLWKGQRHIVINAKDGHLLVIDDTFAPKVEQDVIIIEKWAGNEQCILIPSVEFLVDTIVTITGNYPTLTPGIRMGKDVWQIKQHQEATLVEEGLPQSLLKMAIQIMTPKEGQQRKEDS